jgi:hypothetical protein
MSRKRNVHLQLRLTADESGRLKELTYMPTPASENKSATIALGKAS